MNTELLTSATLKQPGQTKSKRPSDRELARGHTRAHPSETYTKGQVIGGRYEVHDTLGKGGFGVVYLAYDRQSGEVLALKTFRDELLANPAAREAFTKEALLWVELGEHPFVLAAKAVHDFGGRLFVAMRHVAPDPLGQVSLADHLRRTDGPLDLDQTLEWTIQFCLGMEHVNSRGIDSHRDIKPANILIDDNWGHVRLVYRYKGQGTTLSRKVETRRVMITDFGLAAAAEAGFRNSLPGSDSLLTHKGKEGFGLSLRSSGDKLRCGTPGYMAPEVWQSQGAGVRSDVYSFGLVLWQMAAGSRLPPFTAPHLDDFEAYLGEIYLKQTNTPVPVVAGPLRPIIEKCLRPNPDERYGTFGELRQAVEPIFKQRGELVMEISTAGVQTMGYWLNRGISLQLLGRERDAIECFDKALAAEPGEAAAWSHRGACLLAVGQPREALECQDRALALVPDSVSAWDQKGRALADLGRHEEALPCWRRVLEIEPKDAKAWISQAKSLAALGRHQESLDDCAQALALDPHSVPALVRKGYALAGLGRFESAVGCFDEALAKEPANVGGLIGKAVALNATRAPEEAIKYCDEALRHSPRASEAWSCKAQALEATGQPEAALRCYDTLLAIKPDDMGAWFHRGNCLKASGRPKDAIVCYERLVRHDPCAKTAWVNLGRCLGDLGRDKDAIAALDKALALDAQDAIAWSNKAICLTRLGREKEALECFDMGITIEPQAAASWHAKARGLARMRRIWPAIGCCDRALAIDPCLMEVWFDKGNCLYILGRFPEAVECFEKSLALDPRHAVSWYIKAQAEDASKRWPEAINSYQNFVRLAPPQLAGPVTAAMQRLRELESKISA